MIQILRALAALFCAGMLTACASMSANECEFSDWYTIGFEDGSRGLTSDAVSGRRKACARHGFGIDFASYQEGREAGLKEFCQPQRGFDAGSAGQRYRGVCPSDLEPAFLDAYEEGAQLHTLRAAVAQVDSQINSRERELERLHEDIAEYEALLIADDTTTEDRVRVLADLKRSNEQVGQVDTEIQHLISERALRQQDLLDYERWLADRAWR